MADRIASERRTWTLVPINPRFLDYRAAAAAGRDVGEIAPRAIDPRMVAEARGQVPVPPPQPPKIDGICSFPVVYDRRTLNAVTPARTGDGCGSCWTSASLASLESCFAPDEMNDFSEGHMQLRHGDPTAKCGQGGNPDLATFYLAAWHGPVDQKDFNPNARSQRGQRVYVRKHVQNVFFLPNRTGSLDNCWIKLAVMHIGGVYSAISKGYGFSKDYPTYYNPFAGVIHAVTIVGWDDGFDRHKFICNAPSLPPSQQIPPGDGAFIVKDNGGPAWGENGFLYVSYYDASIGTMMAIFTGEPANNYARIYQHDPLGVTRSLTPPSQHPDFSYQGNVFTAAADEQLVAVSFYEMSDPEMDYEIQIHVDPDNGPVRTSGAQATVNVSLLLCGYYTVRLPVPVSLAKGTRFGVVLKGRQRAGGWPSQIPLEDPEGFGDLPITSNPGESFISVDGTTWQDLTTMQIPVSSGKYRTLEGANLCIKAFTKSAVRVDAGLETSEHPFIKWTVTNDGRQGVRVRPVAQGFRHGRGGFEPIGGEIFGVSMEDATGAYRLDDGWIEVPGHATINVSSGPVVLEEVARITYNAYRFDAATNAMLIPDLSQYLLALLHHPPAVVSTNPPQGAHVNYLGLSLIMVTFDRAVKLGPSSAWISVTSSTQSKVITPTISGNELKLLLATPLSSNELGGTTWTVDLPADAVLETVLDEPMDHEYSWTFTVTGVN